MFIIELSSKAKICPCIQSQNPSINPWTHTSTHQPIYLPIHSHAHKFTHPHTYLPIHLPIYSYTHPPTYTSIQCIHQRTHPSTHRLTFLNSSTAKIWSTFVAWNTTAVSSLNSSGTFWNVSAPSSETYRVDRLMMELATRYTFKKQCTTLQTPLKSLEE